MSKIFKLFTLAFTFLILVSCGKNELQEFKPEINQEKGGFLSADCDITGPASACSGTSILYQAVAEHSNAIPLGYTWSVVSGDMTLQQSGASSSQIQVDFGSNFTGGNLKIEVFFTNGDFCSFTKPISKSSSCTSVSSSIMGLNPACPSSTLNYSVSTSGFNNPTYQWSVENGSMNISGSSANSTVNVNFNSDFDGGRLKVVVTEGSLTSTAYLNIDSSVDFQPAIVQDYAPCYDSSSNGQYSLKGYPEGSFVSWSIVGATLVYEGPYIARVSTNMNNSFTLTATIAYQGCTIDYSKTFNPDRCVY